MKVLVLYDYPASPAGLATQGDLLLRGQGDPFLVTERVWQMLRLVRQAGIHAIDGNLLLDDSYFEVPAHDPAEFDRQPLRAYNVMPNALLIWACRWCKLTPAAIVILMPICSVRPWMNYHFCCPALPQIFTPSKCHIFSFIFTGRVQEIYHFFMSQHARLANWFYQYFVILYITPAHASITAY